MYSCDDKSECSASLLQSSVSHDSEIILIWLFSTQETFLIITNVEYSLNSLIFNIWWVEGSKASTDLFIFSNINLLQFY